MPEKEHDLAVEALTNRIFIIRGHRVMFDADLAPLYGVETRVLVQAVKRNGKRFPEDFMFQLSGEEFHQWRSQIVMSNPKAKMGLRRPPYVFTEHGALMLANVLKSSRAVDMSILVVRAFVRLRQLLTTHKELARKLQGIERRLDLTDESVAELYAMIQKLMSSSEEPSKRIGFGT